MDAHVLGADLIERRLLALVTSHRSGVPRDMDLIAADLLSRAADLCPVLTGDLIRSGRVAGNTTTAGSGSVVRRTVSFGTKYAVWIHEAHYNLGPVSRRKSGTEDGPVGRKFLERPFRKHADRYKAFLARGVEQRNRAGTKGG